MNKQLFAFIVVIIICNCGCASQNRVEYPKAEKVQESAASLYEENKEWAKEKAGQVVDGVVDYAAASAAKADELKERFKRRVNDYRENAK